MAMPRTLACAHRFTRHAREQTMRVARRYLSGFSLIIASLALPATALAHVKWFSKFSLADRPASLSDALTPVFITLTILSAIAVGILAVVERRAAAMVWFQRLNMALQAQASKAPLILRITMGATLLLSWQRDSVFAPELLVGAVVGWIEFALAVLLLFRRTVVWAALGILALFAYCVVTFGVFHMLDYVHYLGIAWYLLVVDAKSTRLRESRIPALYIAVGFSLAWLALEKIIYPQWTLYILQQNPRLALGLDPNFFRVGAAFVELSLAYLFLICLFERPIAVLVTIVFMCTTMVFGKLEVIGHTSVHGALIVFLLEGPGTFYRPPIAWHRSVAWRAAFAAVNFVLMVAVGLVAYSATAWHVYEHYTRASSGTAQTNRTAPTGPLVYVSDEGGRTVSVISSGANHVIATIPVGMRPRGIHVSNDGKWIYVALSGSPRCPPTMPDSVCDHLTVDHAQDGIAQIDASTQQVVRTLHAGTDPEQFDVSPDGTRLYVANEDAGTASIIDIAHDSVLARVPVGNEPEGVRVSPDGRTVYVTSEVNSTVTAIDANSRRVLSQVHVGSRPRNLLFFPDHQRYVVSSEVGGTVQIIDTKCNCSISTISFPKGAKPMGLAIAPDGQRVYVATGRFGTIEVIDMTKHQIIGEVKVGTRPWGIALTPDGSTLYVANGPSNTVSAIDTKTLRVKATIPVGILPWGVAIGPS